MPDYNLRSQVITDGLVKNVKRYKQLINTAYLRQDMRLFDELVYEYNWIKAEHPDLYSEAERVAAADFKRNTRLKKRIQTFMDMGNCIFLTLTFTDDFLNRTSSGYRRQVVTRYLKSLSTYYVGNIDFGEENDREHFHAIVVCDHVDLTTWKHGFIYAQKVKRSSNPLRMAKYISKLTNHAVKATCKRNSLIYSRQTFEEWLENNPYKYDIAPDLFPVWFTVARFT